MKSKVKEKNPLVELVKSKASRWNIYTNKDISKFTGVPESNLSRFFNGGGLHVDHVYRLLDRFNLLVRDPKELYGREISSLYERLANINKELGESRAHLNELYLILHNRRKITDRRSKKILHYTPKKK